MNLWDKATQIINEPYPDFLNKGRGWWGATPIPNYGILHGAIYTALKELSDRNDSIVADIPKTADGAPIVPPVDTWRVNGFGELAPFRITELYPTRNLVFGNGYEKWPARCVFSTYAAAIKEAYEILHGKASQHQPRP